MPKTKSAELRIKVIDRCLSDSKRKYSTKMIFDACNEELERRDFEPITAMNSVSSRMAEAARQNMAREVKPVFSPVQPG